jgi:hypothetical protein
MIERRRKMKEEEFIRFQPLTPDVQKKLDYIRSTCQKSCRQHIFEPRSLFNFRFFFLIQKERIRLWLMLISAKRKGQILRFTFPRIFGNEIRYDIAPTLPLNYIFITFSIKTGVEDEP